MGNPKIGRRRLLLIAATLLTVGTGTAAAFDFGNMMNPSRWMGGDRYGDDYYYPGTWGVPGYGYGAPGYGYGAPGYGYGAPGYGYGAPGYGASPYGATGYPPPAYAPGYQAPTASGDSSDDSAKEIEQLKKRIRELEKAATQNAPYPPAGSQPNYAPATPGYSSQPPAFGTPGADYGETTPGYTQPGGFAQQPGYIPQGGYGDQSQVGSRPAPSSPPTYSGDQGYGTQGGFRPLEQGYGGQTAPARPPYQGQTDWP